MEEKPQRNKKPAGAAKASDNEETGVGGATTEGSSKGKSRKKMNKKERRKAKRENR